MLLAIALVQAAAGPAPTVTPRCVPSGAGDEVVICGRRGESPYRLKPLPPRPGDPPRDRLGFKLPGGGSGRVHAIQSNVGGFTGQGLAVTASISLGRKPKR